MSHPVLPSVQGFVPWVGVQVWQTGISRLGALSSRAVSEMASWPVNMISDSACGTENSSRRQRALRPGVEEDLL